MNMVKKAKKTWKDKIDGANYYVRYTEDIQGDWDRYNSCHWTDYTENDGTLEEVAGWLGVDPNDMAVVNGRYIEKLNGLCCFALNACTLQEAIQEARDYDGGHYSHLPKTLWIGEDSEDDRVPDGHIFWAWEPGIIVE